MRRRYEKYKPKWITIAIKSSILRSRAAGTIFVSRKYLRNLMKHWKKLNVKLKWRWNLNSISLLRCKLSVHMYIERVEIFADKLMPAALPLSVPALLFVVWKTGSKKKKNH